MAGGVGACLVVGLAAAAKCDPPFHRARVQPPTAADERLVRSLITKAAGLGSGALPAPWAVAIAEREINAWLALDLPRNHAGLLPPGLSEPRLELVPGRVRGGVRCGAGWLSAVAWAEFEVRSRDARCLVVSVRTAGLGLVPLPGGTVLRSLAGQLARTGLATELVRLDEGTVLMVYMPAHPDPAAAGRPPDSILIESGELLLSAGAPGGSESSGGPR